MNKICVHACMQLGMDPTYTWICELSLTSHKIPKCFYTPENDPNKNFTNFIKKQTNKTPPSQQKKTGKASIKMEKGVLKVIKPK